MTRLTIHVIDLVNGAPAAGVRAELWRSTPDADPVLLSAVRTNATGRTDQPLLADGALLAGSYGLAVLVGEYWLARDPLHPPFLERVSIHFSVADPSADYHLPLLLSPWSVTTYRGS